MTQVKNLLPNLVDLELFSEIVLTEEETKLALLEGRRKKAAALKFKEYRSKVLQEPVVSLYTAEQLLEMVKKIRVSPDGKEPVEYFTIDAFNEEIVWQLCLYFSDDIRCTLDRKKGIYLYGGVGCGKTTLMHFFRHNSVNSYAVFSVRDISYDYAKNGADSIGKYKGLISSTDPRVTYGQKQIGVCFDDLGTEVDKKHYGNESNVMAEILLNRYDRIRELQAKTHITSNLNTTQIEERYGMRVRSRLRELVNVVYFEDSAPDRRK